MQPALNAGEARNVSLARTNGRRGANQDRARPQRPFNGCSHDGGAGHDELGAVLGAVLRRRGVHPSPSQPTPARAFFLQVRFFRLHTKDAFLPVLAWSDMSFLCNTAAHPNRSHAVRKSTPAWLESARSPLGRSGRGGRPVPGRLNRPRRWIPLSHSYTSAHRTKPSCHPQQQEQAPASMDELPSHPGLFDCSTPFGSGLSSGVIESPTAYRPAT
jgi:hypothetical protein